MQKLILIILLTFIYSGMQNSAGAQSFGFGCLGLVGGYAGYSHQVYIPTGLNNYIAEYNSIRNDSLVSPLNTFGKAKGFRLGANLFRANFDGLIFTAKGYYQHLTEIHSSVVETEEGITSGEFDLRIKSWGAGFDLGTSLTPTVSWKVIDAALLFNTSDLTNTQNHPSGFTEVNKYTGKTSLGYSVGTGFILSLVANYISVEGLIAYSVIKIESVTTSEGDPLTTNETSDEIMTNYIQAGGFNAVIQLNIGLPL